MLTAVVYLLFWDYGRLRGLVCSSPSRESLLDPLQRQRLGGRVEVGVYVAGLLSGLGFFSATREVLVPFEWRFLFLPGCLLSFVVALWCGAVAAGRLRSR